MQSAALMFKRAFWVIVLCLAIVSFPLPSFAVAVQDVPNPRQVYRGWVTDMANLLDSETKARLNQMISKLEAKNGTEIAVVTVPDTAPSATPKQFATQLFNYWRIGKKGKNNGVLFLISNSDRQVEIETGYGIEKILPNARVGEIINQQIVPRFKQDDFAYGTVAGIKALVIALEGQDEVNIAAFMLIGLAIVELSAIVYFIQRSNGIKHSAGDGGGGSWSGDGGSWDSDSGGSWDSDSGGSWGGSDSGSFGGGDSGGGGDGGGW